MDVYTFFDFSFCQLALEGRISYGVAYLEVAQTTGQAIKIQGLKYSSSPFEVSHGHRGYENSCKRQYAHGYQRTIALLFSIGIMFN